MCAPVYVVGLLLLLLFGSGLGMVELLARIPTTYVPFAESPLRWAGALAVAVARARPPARRRLAADDARRR